MGRQRIAVLLAALGALLMVLVASPRPALAHLDLVETSPADGAALDAPVSRVVLRFTVAGEPVGPGIRILDQWGETIAAEVRASGGGTTFEVTPSSPLEAGRFGVAWRVAAPDAHPKSGSFRFAVAGPAAAGEAVAAPGDDALAAALEPPDDGGATAVGLAGRVLAYGGGLIAIGGLAFLSLAMVGTRGEVVRCFGLMRLAGALVVAGGIVGILGRGWLLEGGGLASGLSPWAVGGAASGEAELSLMLIVAGGTLIAWGARPAFRPAPRVAVAGEAWRADEEGPIVGATLRNALPALAGCVAVAFGLALDGHSASEGPRALVWLADLVHASAAGIWFGGVILLALVIGWRRRGRRNANVSYAAVRFATLAGAAVGLAGLTGVVLAVVVLPSPSALWDSSWGLLLLAKLALVGAVAAIGAYNHFRLIPRLSATLDARADRPGRAEPAPARAGEVTGAAPAVEEVALTLRRNAAAELVLLSAVVVLTAALVGASAL